MAYLRNLNPAQLQAVEHSPNIPLQILAGPGSGKTRVLTARIAHLIFHHRILPQAICAVTFTNKAANEMRARLQVLVGRHETGLIRMGTFHALCASFLRRHGSKLNLETNFTICDADESKKIIKKLLEDHTKFLADKNVSLTEGTAMSLISKVKARGETADDLRARHLRMKARQSDGRKRRRPQPLDDDQDEDGGTNPLLQDVNVLEVVADVYKRYERKLRQSNSLDFDDLLLFGVRLFERHPSVGEWCEHVLVDEFQDTNTIQYELMRRIAAASGCVTIVGDPDQSIYGWRSAEVKNLRNMLRDFPQTQQILLEQNYRSTASILGASMAIVAQDKKRVAKTLLATHPIGRRPMLQLHLNEYEEATFIATEIKHLVAATGGMLAWGDFVVLLRFNALSRLIESALQKEGIPNRILGGHKFFERLEVKDLLAYLQLIDNPHFVPAFSRAINVPARGIGEKTVAEILATAERLKLSPLTVVTRIHDGKLPDIKPSVKRKLATFVPPMQKLRKLARERTPPSALIRRLLHLVEFEAHLKKTQKDWDSRVENVQELINFASEVETSEGIAGGVRPDAGERWDVDEDWDVLPELDLEDERLSLGSDTPLRLFLQASMLSTDVAAENKDDGKGKVTLTTCHAAKGLEWPVVFIPAGMLEDGTFPSHRAEDVDEERRLLYVACTRAQTLLYLTHANSRMFAGETRKKDLSEFVSIALKENQNSFAREAPHLTANLSAGDRALLAKMLGRQAPDEAEVARRLAEQYVVARCPDVQFSDFLHYQAAESTRL
ncbi:hypothetical protein FOMPIDRAFT_1131483 [Fomitopsis schrenkii]|uniref:DNA 3'-5' helicase n=1 Tax=Fomitopsis schrenkii TaxID=2126942 RepID=S8DTK0_FOMSC|nr:hypothetical protein FOMPIDRAFT_1131483 [Fomitopsis schrenkii]